MSPANKGLSVLTKVLRGKAENLKEGKVKKAESILNLVGKTQGFCEVYLHVGQVMVELASAGVKITKEALSDKKLRDQLTTLAGNCINDMANRMNEFANITEACSKNSAITNAVDNCKVALEENNEALMEANRKLRGIQKRIPKRKFRVIRGDE